MSRAVRLGLLAAVPGAPALQYVLGVAPIWVFVASIVGVGVLADWIRAATEQLARQQLSVAGFRNQRSHCRCRNVGAPRQI